MKMPCFNHDIYTGNIQTERNKNPVKKTEERFKMLR